MTANLIKKLRDPIHENGGATWIETFDLHAAADEIECLRAALTAINDIRNSIIGLQSINWSEHIYPLVAALEAAGIEGMGYPEARKRFGTMLERTNAAEADKDQAYMERNHLVAVVAHLYPSGIRQTDIPGWSQDWHGCVYIDLPTGQVSYHYHDSHAPLFSGLPAYEGEWDGHDKETVHQRLGTLRSDSGHSIHSPQEGSENG